MCKGLCCGALCAVCLGLALGIVKGLCLFVMGMLAWLYGWGSEKVTEIGTILIGYDATPLGSLYGALEGFVIAFIFGLIIGILYNFFAKRCCKGDADKSCCKQPE